MLKKTKAYSDEINIIDLLQTLWLGKWKIITILLIIVGSVYTYEYKKKNDKIFYTATSEIVPISTLEEYKYMRLNNFDFNNDAYVDDIDYPVLAANLIDDNNYYKLQFNVTKAKLFALFLEMLNDKELFQHAIRKNNLLDPSQYENEQKYDEAIIQIASTIIIEETVAKGKKKKENLNFTIKFSHYNSKEWKNILNDVNELANKAVKKNLQNQFQLLLKENKKKKEYKIEDITIRIDNLYKDYESIVSKKILYLKEQSEIAKKLGIAKNTIEVQTFGNQNTLFSNVKTDTPFYLRGYEAIDKEIELITLRTDKKPFIEGLLDLEKDKRSIEQDKSVERIESILSLSPLADNNDFYAGTIKGISTKFDYYEIKKSFLILSIVIGLIMGILYVIISNAIVSQIFKKKKIN